MGRRRKAVLAVVVLKPGQAATPEELRLHCRGALGGVIGFEEAICAASILERPN